MVCLCSNHDCSCSRRGPADPRRGIRWELYTLWTRYPSIIEQHSWWDLNCTVVYLCLFTPKHWTNISPCCWNCLFYVAFRFQKHSSSRTAVLYGLNSGDFPNYMLHDGAYFAFSSSFFLLIRDPRVCKRDWHWPRQWARTSVAGKGGHRRPFASWVEALVSNGKAPREWTSNTRDTSPFSRMLWQIQVFYKVFSRCGLWCDFQLITSDGLLLTTEGQSV